MIKNDVSLYVHIPICLKKCNYCDFCSFPVRDFPVEDYITSLTHEIKTSLEINSIESIKTIYIGGGTPNTISLRQLEKFLLPLLNKKFNNNYEFTMEINPALSDLAYFKDLKSLGINRISIGVQSFDDRLLTLLGRIHTTQESYKTLHNILKAGFRNISIDLMYGLPEQTLKLWQETLHIAKSLDITHISAYGLKIEPRTPFYLKYSKEDSGLPDDHLQQKMFYETHHSLALKGFHHYEISNYAKEGFQCVHNINYWENGEYYGFGLAAHSFYNQSRIENTSSIKEYLSNPLKAKTVKHLPEKELLEDEIFLNLRLSRGLNIDELNNKFNIDFIQKYERVLEKYDQYFTHQRIEGHDNLSLTLEGMLLSNFILSEFIE